MIPYGSPVAREAYKRGHTEGFTAGLVCGVALLVGTVLLMMTVPLAASWVVANLAGLL